MEVWSDEDEEEIDEIQRIFDNIPVRRSFLMRPDWFEDLGDADFRDRFRLQKGDVLRLTEILRPRLEPRTLRPNVLSALDKVLITLR